VNVARTIAETRRAISEARAAGRTIGFVPTMGFLHEGHLSLVDQARAAGADFVVVSIFVNPTQFGPGEDFERYPRDEARDSALLTSRGVDLLLAPPPDVMYPPGAATRINVGPVAEPLEGERRPGHFDGVATIVMKLFNIVLPDLAVFGEKDAQQCAVISRMVRDLDVPVRLLFGRTVREEDGLAMSSRNAYLSPEERKRSPALYEALRAGQSALETDGSADTVEKAMRGALSANDGVQLDYLSLVDPATFRTPEGNPAELLLVGAVRVGRTRLIDNLRIPQQTSQKTVAVAAGERQPGSQP
jgi:pantoate--beta-alanine ligase